MRENRTIGWAFAASLAFHCLFLFLMLEFAPWKVLKSGHNGPMVIELNSVTIEKAEKGIPASRPDSKKLQRQPDEREKAEQRPAEQPSPIVASPEVVVERPDTSNVPVDNSPSQESDTSSTRTDTSQQFSALSSAGGWHKEYSETLRETIEKQQRYPIMAMRSRQEGTVEVSFLLERSGFLLECRITRSCGHSLLDRAALAAVEEVGRFPPFPAEIKLDQATFIIPITFRLDR